MPPEHLIGAIAASAKLVDATLDAVLPRPEGRQARVQEAMRYAIMAGGKRLRPFLVLHSARLFGVDDSRSLRVGAAIESLHTYSLVHDDLPCMDDDDLRRGRPTVHKAYDEATAVLAGDSLHALAFEVIADPETHADPFVRAELALELAKASGPAGMAGGQMMDLMAEAEEFDLGAVARLQQLKTGALIGFCLEAGAILGHIPPEGRRTVRAYARDIGLAFQIADDLLDVEGAAEVTGKAVGKDAAQGKATFVSLLGPERARQQAEMLVDQAIGHLAGFGSEATLLRAIARYVVERDR